MAMLVAVNSKHHRYEPAKYMANGAEWMRRARQAQAERAAGRGPMNGGQVVDAFRRAGMVIIDNRTKPELMQ